MRQRIDARCLPSLSSLNYGYAVQYTLSASLRHAPTNRNSLLACNAQRGLMCRQMRVADGARGKRIIESAEPIVYHELLITMCIPISKLEAHMLFMPIS